MRHGLRRDENDINPFESFDVRQEVSHFFIAVPAPCCEKHQERPAWPLVAESGRLSVESHQERIGKDEASAVRIAPGGADFTRPMAEPRHRDQDDQGDERCHGSIHRGIPSSDRHEKKRHGSDYKCESRTVGGDHESGPRPERDREDVFQVQRDRGTVHHLERVNRL